MAKQTELTANEQQLPSYIKTGVSRGNENVSNDDIQLPRIEVLQALSPQVNKKNPAYIDGAEQGMLFNTLTHELYADGIRVTPVHFATRYLVWVDRKIDTNGGFRGSFSTQQEADQLVSGQQDRDKLEVIRTAEHIVILDDGSEAIISMAKSKAKVSRKWNSLVRLNGGDRFSRSYKLTAIEDKSAKGEYMNIDVANDGFPSEQVYLHAEKLYESIASGGANVRGDYSDGGQSGNFSNDDDY